MGRDDRLPLRPSAFAVLAALGRRPRTGVEILEQVSSLGTGILGPGTLYRVLRELRAVSLIERVAAPDGDEGDDRRRYHALTPEGRHLLDAEAARLRRTLQDAGLLEEPGT